MQKITPHLWFDKEAKQAAELYTSIFENSSIKNIRTIHNTPSGDCDIVTFELAGQEFMSISAGPYFKFTPAISFLVACKDAEEVQKIWDALIPEGMALMELGEYPFSKKYGWLQDRFGLSWQIMDFSDRTITQKITPTLMFVGDVCGKAEEAMQFYTSLFEHSKMNVNMRYEAGEGLDQPGTVKHANFTLAGQEFAAMDSAYDHQFNFNEAISFIVSCTDQAEVDHFWNALSAVPEAEQCGWLKDRYGVSWQIIPTALNEMMSSATPEQLDRLTQAFLKMKKFDIAKLREAFENN